MDMGAALPKNPDNLKGRGFTCITDIRLVGDANDEYPGSFDALLSLVQGIHHFRDHVFGHVAVDLPGEFNKTCLETARACFPGEVEWIHGDTVAAEAGPGIERHKSERFRGGSVNDLPNI
jgi:hypothetical protein